MTRRPPLPHLGISSSAGGGGGVKQRGGDSNILEVATVMFLALPWGFLFVFCQFRALALVLDRVRHVL